MDEDRNRIQLSELDDAIDQVQTCLDLTKPGSDEYAALVENLKELKEIKRNEAKTEQDLELAKKREIFGIPKAKLLDSAIFAGAVAGTILYECRDMIKTSGGWRIIEKVVPRLFR